MPPIDGNEIYKKSSKKLFGVNVGKGRLYVARIFIENKLHFKPHNVNKECVILISLNGFNFFAFNKFANRKLIKKEYRSILGTDLNRI